MSDLLEVIINQLIGVVIGSVVSFIMSYYFYKLTDFPSRVSASMIENVLLMLIQDRIGASFNSEYVVSNDELPKDLDKPHILHFWLTTDTPRPGDSINILFRVRDKGLNFPGPSHIEITENTSNLSFPATRQGHGYYTSRITIPSNAIPAIHSISFRMTDRNKKTHIQKLKINVN